MLGFLLFTSSASCGDQPQLCQFLEPMGDGSLEFRNVRNGVGQNACSFTAENLLGSIKQQQQGGSVTCSSESSIPSLDKGHFPPEQSCDFFCLESEDAAED